MARVVLALLALLAAPAAAVSPEKKATKLPSLNKMSLATIPMHMYAQDCHKQVIAPVALHAAQVARRQKAGVKVPGAGMDPENIVPYAKVLKDGFMEVECIKDYLYEFGDKFGDGKFSYKMGPVSNVSIVHYTEVVPKEDREPMTHEVCFEFCRTVPDMHFFGLFNGRDCYCTPYYKAMAGDSSQCDAVCEGKPTTMCGGKKKSTMFSMHSCADTEEVLTETEEKVRDVEVLLNDAVDKVEKLSTTMQSEAETFQGIFGPLGDPAASDLMQSAKVFAGDLEKAFKPGKKISEDINTATGDVVTLKAGKPDFTDFDTVGKAEELSKKMEKLTADAEDEIEELEKMTKLADASDAEEEDAQYYPIMYFVDKEFEDVPATCTGTVLNKPMVATSEAACAKACDVLVGHCEGYGFYPGAQDANLCFLFKKFKEVKYYAGCAKDDKGGQGKFLQADKKKATLEVKCQAKLMSFEGMNISPDKSGKCKTCLKEAAKADRCPEQ